MMTLIRKEMLALQKSVFMYVLTAVITTLFVINGIYYSSKYSEYLHYRERALSRIADVPYSKMFFLPPNPALFCCDNNEKQTSTAFWVSLAGLELNTISNDQKGNLFLAASRSIDWIFIVQFVFSLLMIVLSYNVITGEIERKTMSLVCSYSLSRWKIYLSKFLSIFLLAAVILAITMLTGFLTILFRGKIPIDTPVIIKMALFYGISLIYCAFFILLGLGVSASVHNSTLSLVVSILLWITIILIFPKTSSIIVARLLNDQSEYTIARQYDNWDKEYQTEMQNIFQDAQKIQNEPESLREQSINEIKSRISIADEKKADQQYQLIDTVLHSDLDRYRTEQRWVNTSPAALFRDTVENTLHGGNAYFLDYLNQVRNFSSRFREDMYNRYRTYVIYHNGMMISLSGQNMLIMPDSPSMENNHMEFEYHHYGVFESVKKSMGNISLLALMTVTVALWGFIGFLRCDIR